MRVQLNGPYRPSIRSRAYVLNRLEELRWRHGRELEHDVPSNDRDLRALVSDLRRRVARLERRVA